MFEIELKARVSLEERPGLIQRLNGFASYRGAVKKSDSYYALEDKKRCRIRMESPFRCPEQPLEGEAEGQSHVFFTYKRKELRVGSDGHALEVNDEKECELSDADPLRSCLLDNGFSLVQQKEKSVLGWQWNAVHIELCSVPPLGDFLELETFAPDSGAATVEAAQRLLKGVLKKAGIAETAIENRYYSELLREAEKALEKK